MEEDRDNDTKIPATVDSIKSTHRHKPSSKTTPLVPQKVGVQTAGGCGSREGMGVASGGKLSVEKLLSILKGFGEYPAKYRYIQHFTTVSIISLLYTYTYRFYE